MSPWFKEESNIIQFPDNNADKDVFELPSVVDYKTFSAGVKDLHHQLNRGKISQRVFDKLYEDLLGRFARSENVEQPWFLREDDEDVKRKERVIRALSKKRADDPIFDKTYKLIVGPQIGARIENYIGSHKDPDIGAEEMAFLVKTIPDLGTTEEVKSFVEKWNSGEDIIKVDQLVPSSGMESPATLSSIVDDGIGKELFARLVPLNFGKSDAGPAEAALAVMSKRITYATSGGDLVIDGAKIEIKGGGRPGKKGKIGGGGRVYNDKLKLDQKGMAQALAGTPYETAGSVTVAQASSQLPEDFPAKEFIEAASLAWYGEIKSNIVNSFGTPDFKRQWAIEQYNDYKEEAGHDGILIIGGSNYQYIVNGEQLHTVGKAQGGHVYSPNSNQTRDLGIQVKIG